MSADRFDLGQRVVARDAHNKLLPATVVPVDAYWRDASDSKTYTTRGDFPKVWLRFQKSGHIAPWPAVDVFSDLAEAEAAVHDFIKKHPLHFDGLGAP